MIAVWILIAIVIVLVLAVVGLYNMLIMRRNRVREASSDIDIQLKRRYELIPNLANTLKGYATHERDVHADSTTVVGLPARHGACICG